MAADRAQWNRAAKQNPPSVAAVHGLVVSMAEQHVANMWGRAAKGKVYVSRM